MPPDFQGRCRLSLPPGSWGSPFQPASFSAGFPVREGEPPSRWGSRTPLPGMDAPGCGAGQDWGHPLGPSSIFCLLAWSGQLGTGSLWEACLSPAGTLLPSLWGGLSSRTDPTLFWVARKRLFPAACGAGAALALPGTGDAKQGPHWLQSNHLGMGS